MRVSTQFEWRQRSLLMDEHHRLGRLLGTLRSAATSRIEYEPHDIIDDEAAIQADAIEDRLTAIDSALGRLDAGSYGLCCICEEPIASERLEALPSVTLCLRCVA